jgi:hypothetical protein
MYGMQNNLNNNIANMYGMQNNLNNLQNNMNKNIQGSMYANNNNYGKLLNSQIK